MIKFRPITEYRSNAAREFNRLQWRMAALLCHVDADYARVAVWIADHTGPYVPRHPFTRPEARMG